MDILTLALAKNGGGASSWNDLKDKPFGEEHSHTIVLPDSLNLEQAYDFGSYIGVEEALFYKVNRLGAALWGFTNPTVYVPSYNTGNYIQDKSAVWARLPNEELGLPDSVYLYFLESWRMETDENGYTSDILNYRFFFASIMGGELGVPAGDYVCCLDFEDRSEDISCWSSGGFKLVDEYVYRLDEKYLPYLVSPNGNSFTLSVSDDGTITATEVT